VTALAPHPADAPTAAPRPQLPPTDHVPRPYDGPSRDEILAMRRQFANPAVFTLYREPLLIVEGHMQYLYDETGRRYLDLFAGIVTVSVGHCHPAVVRRVQEQAATLQHATTIYLHPNFPLLAKKLASKMPAGLDVTYFVNSGSEANDLAITMARLHTGHRDVIAVRNAYHGGSPSAQGLTSHHTWKFPGGGDGHVHHAVNPDPYRSPFDGTPEEIATKSARDIREIVRTIVTSTLECIGASPPDLVQDVLLNGITLTGGGSLLSGLDMLLSQETEVPVHVTDQPLESVVQGAGRCLEAFDTAKAVSAETGLPIVSIPTTYSGAEWTPYFGVRDHGRRMRGGGAGARVEGIVYEPELTVDLPRAETVGTALNALAHCAEALYVRERTADSDAASSSSCPRPRA